MWYLYGIINDGKEIDFGEIGLADPYGKQVSVRSIPYKDIAIVASEMDEWHIDEQNKQDLMQKLLAHQKTLEEVMRQRLVIPVKFGTVVKDMKDVEIILERGSAVFKSALADMEGRFEVNLTASWDIPTQLKRIAEEDEEIKAMKREAQTSGSRELIMKIGMELEDKLEGRRKKVASEIFAFLDGWCGNQVDHERLENKMIFNASFLISKDNEGDFLKSIHQLDKEFGGEFSFKCLMPLPPHSFRTVLIQRIVPERLREAIELFEVGEGTTLEDLKEKNRELTQRYHPDTLRAGGERAEGEQAKGEQKFSQIHETYDLLKAFYKMEERPFANLDIERCYLTRVVEGSV